MHPSTSTDSKTFAVVVSLVEYIQKQQMVHVDPKKPNCGISAGTIGEIVKHNRDGIKQQI